MNTKSYPRGRIEDYCGYCGAEFKRRASDPEGVCRECIAEPRVQEDIEYAEADAANERDLEARARRGEVR